MTIKELCEKSDCGNCVFYSLCVLTSKFPKQYDKLYNQVVSDAIIKTARILQEDKNND